MILLLLGSSQEELLSSDGLEGAVEVIKISVPPFAEQNVEWLVSEVLSLDVSKDLDSYEVRATQLLISCCLCFLSCSNCYVSHLGLVHTSDGSGIRSEVGIRRIF